MPDSASFSSAYLQLDQSRLWGVNAEMISVLMASRYSGSTVPSDAWPTVARAFDTATPHEERVQAALSVVADVKKMDSFAKWLPRYDGLHEHEYSQEFFVGYRDHTIHALHVLLLGLYLFETVPALRAKIEARLKAVAPDARDKQLAETWWILTALWHDAGYCFEGVDLLTDVDRRARTLKRVSDDFSHNIFLDGLESVLGPQTAARHRELYQAGRFFPLEYGSTAQILGHATVKECLGPFWERLGLGAEGVDTTVELDRLTTQASAIRPPFHDHGLYGSALLAIGKHETMQFLANLVESGGLGQDADKIADEWLNLECIAPVVVPAVEAIAFHNLNFGALEEGEKCHVLCPPSVQFPLVSAATEPHVFFLCIVDVLQSWDRHHFRPLSAGAYEPTKRSADILVQGRQGKIYVSVANDTRAAVNFRNQFKGWLPDKDVSELFFEGAEFTFPDAIRAGDAPTVSQGRASAKVRDQLCELVRAAADKTRAELVRAAPDSILNASSVVDDLNRRIEEVRDVLLKTDLDRVLDALENSGMSRTTAQAFSLISIGTKLRLGTIEDRIGGGGFGAVYRVKPNRPLASGPSALAFKLFHGQDLNIPEKKRLFHRGFLAMQKLGGHPNIVQVMSYSELPLGFFMEYIPGCDLEAETWRTSGVVERLRLLVEIGETIAYAHGQGVLHRDIKPGNILLSSDKDDRPILTDFDLAWMDGRTQQTKGAYASMLFGAPEQFDPKLHEMTRKPTVDVYGYGALLYYVLTNQLPPVNAAWEPSHWLRLEQALEGHLPAIAVRRLLENIPTWVNRSPSERVETMETVLAQLGAVFAEVRSSDDLVDTQNWVAETAYAASGNAKVEVGTVFGSRAGGVNWQIEIKTRDDRFNVGCTCTMNRDPVYDGVNFDGFRKGSMKQVDKRLREVESSGAEFRAKRTGRVSGAGSSMQIFLDDVPRTTRSARIVGDLLASLSRIVE